MPKRAKKTLRKRRASRRASRRAGRRRQRGGANPGSAALPEGYNGLLVTAKPSQEIDAVPGPMTVAAFREATDQEAAEA